ncbi:hypothetical protein BH09PSE5_BH09PSE5_00030 [soil metagenome]
MAWSCSPSARPLIGITLLALAGAAFAADAPMPGVDAIVSYETRVVLASGVTRVDTWQERLVRRSDQVWTERILPSRPHDHEGHADHVADGKATGKAKTPEHIGHKHFNGDTSARWLQRQGDRSVELKLVDRENKVVVSIPRNETATVGADSDIDSAGSIVPTSVVRSMKPAKGPGESSDLSWKSDASGGWKHRILWSESRQLAMKVISERDDGSVRRVVNVALQPQSGSNEPPWRKLGDYESKNFSDFGD